MAAIRIASFNCENLFARYKFNKNIDPKKAVIDGWRADDRHFEIFDEAEKKITGDVISRLDADIIALVEVENLDTLKRFRDQYVCRGKNGPMGRAAYPYALVIDGNDPRLIDVAVLSAHPIVSARSYQHERLPSGKDWLFSRDCLVADIVMPNAKQITLFVNHFKSMLDKKDGKNGRKNTRDKRVAQAVRVREIVKERFGADPSGAPFIVLGDLNDYLETDAQGPTSLGDLVGWSAIESVVERLPAAERWTHFFASGKTYHQLDYLLPSRMLAASNPHAPEIERYGLALGAARYTGERHPDIEQKGAPKKDRKRAASDHCPVVFTVNL